MTDKLSWGILRYGFIGKGIILLEKFTKNKFWENLCEVPYIVIYTRFCWGPLPRVYPYRPRGHFFRYRFHLIKSMQQSIFYCPFRKRWDYGGTKGRKWKRTQSDLSRWMLALWCMYDGLQCISHTIKIATLDETNCKTCKRLNKINK